jgi:anti-sigma B factor antagonist
MKEMRMKIGTRTIGDVHVMDCSGKITLGQGTMSIRNTVLEILKTGGRNIVLNLADVNYIDSPGVGELVRSYNKVFDQGGQLKLLCLTKKIQEVLAITRLLTVFQVYDSETAMLASFGR